jgi:hypothetical protein
MTYIPNTNANLVCLSVFTGFHELVPIIGWRIDPPARSDDPYEVAAAPVTIQDLSPEWAIHDAATGATWKPCDTSWATLDEAIAELRANVIGARSSTERRPAPERWEIEGDAF